MVTFFSSIKAWFLGLMIAQDPLAQDFRQEFRQVFNIAGQYQLQLKNHNGSVDISSHNGQDLIVATTIMNRTRAITSTVACDQSVSNGLTSILCTTQSIQSNQSIFSFGESDEVKYIILVPRKECQKVSVTNHNGAITTNNLAGLQKLLTHNGAISVTSADDCITAQTHNGAITVKNPGALFDLETHNGAIKVDIAQKIIGDCSARTHNGAVTVIGSKYIAGTLDAATKNGYKSIL